MKPYLKLILSFCITFNVLIIQTNNVDALHNDEYMDLDNYIISGSEEDPYILDRSCPMLVYYEEQVREEIGVNAPQTMFLDDFSGNLAGIAHTGQINGGKWTYSSGGYSASSDNVTRIYDAIYSIYKENIDMISAYENGTYRGNINLKLAQGIYGAALKTALMGLGMPSGLAGNVSKVLVTATTNLQLSSPDFAIMKRARDNRHGLLTIKYAVSYQGNWYASTCFDVWSGFTVSSSNVNTIISSAAREPTSNFGIGVYGPKQFSTLL